MHPQDKLLQGMDFVLLSCITMRREVLERRSIFKKRIFAHANDLPQTMMKGTLHLM